MSSDYFGLYAIAVLAIVMLFLGGRALDENGRVRVGQGDPVSRPTLVSDGYGVQEMFIQPSRGGSFLTEIWIEGAPVEVLVDTGASYTTLRESDASRAGIRPRSSEYTHQFSTANGLVFAARAEADDLEMGPALFSDVTVFVLPDEKLQTSLLGMNVLREFDRMEMTQEGLRLSVD